MAHKVAKRYSRVTNVTMLVLSEHTMHCCVVCGHWPARPALLQCKLSECVCESESKYCVWCSIKQNKNPRQKV